MIFPEGTRRADGTLGDFKPLVGRLALATNTPVLPMHLTGTFEALPRGTALPKPRALVARIGAPLRVADLTSASGTEAERARAATARIRDAVGKLGGVQVATVSEGNERGTRGEQRQQR